METNKIILSKIINTQRCSVTLSRDQSRKFNVLSRERRLFYVKTPHYSWSRNVNTDTKNIFQLLCVTLYLMSQNMALLRPNFRTESDAQNAGSGISGVQTSNFKNARTKNVLRSDLRLHPPMPRIPNEIYY
jgi:hypothetical protein